MFNLIAFCVLTEMVFGSVIEDAPTAVVNGELAYIEDFPFYALLFYADYNTVLCGSSIISTKVLLTAAHCIDTGDKIIAYVGISSLYGIENRKPYKVKKTIVHPDYDVELAGVYDIGLVLLKKRIKLGPTAQIIALAISNPEIDEETTVIGFGAVICLPSTDICQKSKHLRTTEMTVRGYGESNAIQSISNSSNVCYGDSGGPMIYDNQVVGVASTVDNAGCMTGGNTYTAVFKSLDWIKKYGKV